MANTEFRDTPESIRRQMTAKGLAEIEVVLGGTDPIVAGLVKDIYHKRIRYTVENMARLIGLPLHGAEGEDI